MRRGAADLPWPDQPWGDVRRAWPSVLEPVGLDEPTRPALGGASRSATGHRPPAGPAVVAERQAIALLRVPAASRPPDRPDRYLAWVLLRGALQRDAFSSHITRWWPAVPIGEEQVGALSFDGGPTLEVALSGDGQRWVSAPVRVPAGVLPG